MLHLKVYTNSPLLCDTLFGILLVRWTSEPVPWLSPEMQPDLNRSVSAGRLWFRLPLTLPPWSPLFIRVPRVLLLELGGRPAGAVTHKSWSRGPETCKETRLLT